MDLLHASNSEVILDHRYKLIRKIGQGSFGDIILGICLKTNEEVAIKMESLNAKHPQLIYESRVIRLFKGGTGFPRIHHVTRNSTHSAMVLDLLGPSLEDLFNFCGRRFSLKTVLMLSFQMLDRLEYIHQKDMIHRDIKPENFLMGHQSNCNKVYLIDFGLSKRFRDQNISHIPYRNDKNLIGTARYASINAHVGIEQSRRDDLESLGYVLLYFNKGSLPWQGMISTTKQQKYEKILEKKRSTPIEILCANSPQEFLIFLKSARDLGFSNEPAYNQYKRLFYRLFTSLTFSLDYHFDWSMKYHNTRVIHDQ
uniref:Protein kinase domain-containing protein n=1 Tax=Rhabditophanes sp. KR3021 TaxID=114890 RepID=A0AC35THQ0_9BILA